MCTARQPPKIGAELSTSVGGGFTVPSGNVSGTAKSLELRTWRPVYAGKIKKAPQGNFHMCRNLSGSLSGNACQNAGSLDPHTAL